MVKVFENTIESLPIGQHVKVSISTNLFHSTMTDFENI